MAGAARAADRPRPGALPVVVVVIAVALVAWVASAAMMSGMSRLPGAGLGPLTWFVSLWVVMMAAMMLPSVWPMVVAHVQASAAHARFRGEVPLSAVLFVLGYLLSWTAYGVAAYALYRGIALLQLEWLAWTRYGALAAGIVIAAAGLYQLTPLKRRCLRHCRSPLRFIVQEWRPGARAALRMGVRHGLWCVGCCAGLMLLLLVLGAMSLLWMGVVTTLIFVEKLAPWPRVRLGVAALCVALGIAVAAAPSFVTALAGSSVGMAQAGMSMH